MKEIKNNILLVGIPQTGKSTYLASLWHVVESDEVDKSLTLTSLPDNREYLNILRGSWLKCEPIERNKLNFIKHNSIAIRDNNNDKEYSLMFPDVSGELFELQFQNREVTNEFLSLLNSSCGILFFIHPNISEPELITDADRILNETENPQNENTIKKWNHKDVPTQVILVDILQIITTFLNNKIKLSVIISAWDEIIDLPEEIKEIINPEEWVKKRLPLFYQYIIANDDTYTSKFFGISAQGAKYESDNSKLNNYPKQSDRIRVQIESDIGNDITQPIKWILNGN